ncbi:hypothetical protein DERF_009323 [Dermatophagoides farinae]|uniref:Uncharacterized protein n=1 Tax=Dermatophagoides farinae TaxID=6954 RepID=A0A922L1D1_DERFA|nr:uncharacterized protein LOC124494512 [Dermatophagoides farinae]KAH7637051.1 hypothetical protein HUG17_7257 [Dermatophagoides farinae]KAH9510817.1 hypothetical protein DERF_009323 [Dermatophagoides farinae]
MSAIPFITFSTPDIHQKIREQQRRQRSGGRDDPPRGQKYSQSNRTPSCSQLKDMNDKMKSNAQSQFTGEMYNYNLKFMNSVWGLYNRYAPQAFQKNLEFRREI